MLGVLTKKAMSLLLMRDADGGRSAGYGPHVASQASAARAEDGGSAAGSVAGSLDFRLGDEAGLWAVTGAPRRGGSARSDDIRYPQPVQS